MEDSVDISIIDFDISNEETKRKIMILKNMNIPCSMDVYIQQQNQKRIREESKILFPELFSNTANKSVASRKKSNYYGIQICLITVITQGMKNEDLLKNIEIRQITTNMTEEDFAQFIDDKFCCACSHQISSGNVWMVYNIITGKWIHSGCTCITKHKLLTKEEM